MIDGSNITSFIRKLRKKIEPVPDNPQYIITVWGVGYKFNEERMQKQMILLPTAANGQPDYDYMEQYAKKLFSSLRLQYLHEKVTVAI